MGSGAAEVGRALALDGPAWSGRVTIGDQGVPCTSRAAAVAAGIGYIPGERAWNGIFRHRSVRENATASILAEIRRGLSLSRGRELAATREHLAVLAVRPADPEARMDVLSGGNQQKVLVARTLASRALKVIVAIEPTRGVDVGAREEIHRALAAAAAEGIAVLIVSSDLDELRRLRHRVLVMRAGAVVAELAAGYDSAILLRHLTGAA